MLGSKHDAPVLPKCVFTLLLNFCYASYSLYSGLHEVAVVANRHISTLLEVDGRVLDEQLRVTLNMEDGTRTIVISFPAAFRNAFVHLTLRGLRFILNYRSDTRGHGKRIKIKAQHT
jgi:hypothetical protein